MKKVLIIPSNTDLNRGDQALVWESIRLVEDVYGKDNVHCNLMSGLEGNNAYLQNRQTAELGYSFVAPLLKHPGRNFSTRKEDSTGYSKLTILRWGFQALTDYLHTFLLLSGRRAIRLLGEKLLSKDEKQTLDAIKGCDAVFVKGGGFIHSYGAITDSYFIYFLTFHIRVAEAYGKKVFLLPNSIGPLKNVDVAPPFVPVVIIDSSFAKVNKRLAFIVCDVLVLLLNVISISSDDVLPIVSGNVLLNVIV